MLPDTVQFVTSVTDPTRWEKPSLRGSTTDSSGPKEFHHAQQDGFFSAKALLVEPTVLLTPAVDTAISARSTMGDEPNPTNKDWLDKFDSLINTKHSLIKTKNILLECWHQVDPEVPDHILSKRLSEGEPHLPSLAICTFECVRDVRDTLHQYELPAQLQRQVEQMLSLSGTAAGEKWESQADIILETARHACHLISAVLVHIEMAEVGRALINAGDIPTDEIPEWVGSSFQNLNRLMSGTA